MTNITAKEAYKWAQDNAPDDIRRELMAYVHGKSVSTFALQSNYDFRLDAEVAYVRIVKPVVVSQLGSYEILAPALLVLGQANYELWGMTCHYFNIITKFLPMTDNRKLGGIQPAVIVSKISCLEVVGRASEAQEIKARLIPVLRKARHWYRLLAGMNDPVIRGRQESLDSFFSKEVFEEYQTVLAFQYLQADSLYPNPCKELW